MSLIFLLPLFFIPQPTNAQEDQATSDSVNIFSLFDRISLEFFCRLNQCRNGGTGIRGGQASISQSALDQSVEDAIRNLPEEVLRGEGIIEQTIINNIVNNTENVIEREVRTQTERFFFQSDELDEIKNRLTELEENPTVIRRSSGGGSDDQELSLTGTDLTIGGGNTVSLASVAGGVSTIDSLTIASGTLAIVSAGATSTVDLSDFYNSALTFASSTNILSLTDGSSTIAVDLSLLSASSSNALTTLSASGSSLVYLDENATSTTIDIVDLLASSTAPLSVTELNVTGTTTLSGPTILNGTTTADILSATSITAVDLTTTNATSTNFFSNIINSLTATFTNLFATNATIDSLVATTTNTVDLTSTGNTNLASTTLAGPTTISGTTTIAAPLFLSPLGTGTSSDNILVVDPATGQVSQISSSNLVAENETLTLLSASGTELVYVDENGATTTLDLLTLTGASSTDELQTLSYATSTGVLTISDGNTVDLSSLDNASTTDELITAASYSTSTNTLTITDAGNTYNLDLSELEDNTDSQALSYSTSTNILTISGTTTPVDLSGLVSTDNQNLESAVLTNGELVISIEDGASTTVDLSSLFNSALTFATSTGTLSLTDGSSTLAVDLSSLDTSSTTDELNTSLAFSSTTNTLGITDNGGLLTTIIDALSNITLLGTTVADVFTANEATITDLTTTNATTTDLVVLGDFTTAGALNDSDGDAGAVNQVLVSTATGTNWVNVSDLETLSTLTASGSDIIYVNEDGSTTTIDVIALSGASTTDELQNLAFSTTTGSLSLSGSTGTVDLASYITNTLAGTSTLATTTISQATINELILNPIGTGTTTNDILVRDPSTGEVSIISPTDLVTANQTLTVLSDNTDGTFSYVDENGVTTTINIANLLSNATGTLTVDSLAVTGTTTLSGPTILNGTTTADILSATSITAVDLTTTNATSTNLFSNIINSLTATFTNLFATNATIDSLVATTTQTDTFTIVNPATGTSTDNIVVIDPSTGEVGEISAATLISELETTTSISTSTDSFTYTDEDGNTTEVSIADLETLTTLSYSSSTGDLTYIDEDGSTTTLALGGIASTTDELITSATFSTTTDTLTITDAGNTYNISLADLANTDDQSLSYATATNILTLEDGGLVDLTELIDDADASSTNELQILSFATSTGLLTLSNGNTVDLSTLDTASTTDELITAVSFSTTTNELVISEAGVNRTIDLDTFGDLTIDGNLNISGELLDSNGESGTTGQVLSATATGTDWITPSTFSDTDAQTLSSSGTVITLSAGTGTSTSVDIAALVGVSSTTDELNTSLAFSSTTNTLGITDNGGLLTTIIDALSNITLLGTTVMDTFTANTGTITDLTTTNATTTNLVVTGDLDLPAGSIEATDLAPGLAASTTDELNQTLSFSTSTNQISLTDNGGTLIADLSTLVSTDNQNLESAVLSGNLLTISIEDGASTTVDLSSLSSSTDELITSASFATSTGILTITDAGNTFNLNLSALNQASSTDELQTLSFATSTNILTLSGGNTVDLTDLVSDPETVTTLVDNGNNTFTYTSESGATTTIDVTAGETLTLLSSTGSSIQYIDELGATTTLNIADLETTTALSFDGTNLSYIDEDGATTTLNISTIASSTDEFNTALSFSSTTNTISSTDGGGILTAIIDALSNITLLGTTVADVFTANEATITDLTTTNATTTDLVVTGQTNLATTTISGPLTLTGSLSLPEDSITALELNETGVTAGTFGSTTEILTLTLDEDGRVTAVATSSLDISGLETTTTIATSGSTFIYTDEDGASTIVDIADLETLTTLSLSTSTNILSYTDEDGNPTNLNLSDYLDNTDSQELSLAGNTLSISGTSTPIDLSPYLDNTDNQNLESAVLSGNLLTISIEDGASTTVDLSNLVDDADASSTNELLGSVSFATSSDELTITDAGNSFVISLADLANTDDQSLTYSTTTNILTLEDGGTVDLSALANTSSSTDEFNTALSFSSTTNTISSTDGGGILTAIIDALSNITLLGTTVADVFTANSVTTDTLTATTTVTETITINSPGTGTTTDTIITRDGSGNLREISATSLVDAVETLTSVATSGSTFTYTDEDGNNTLVDITDLETLTALSASTTLGTLTYTDEDGTANTVDLTSLIAAQETTTTLSNNGDGSFSYVNEDGATTTIDIKTEETTTSVFASGSNINYVDEDGATTTIDIADLETNTALLVNIGAGTITYQSEAGTTTVATITDLETTTSISLTGSEISYIDEDGATTTIDIASGETTTTITTLGSVFTYTDEDGATTTVDIANLETLTTLSQNGDGTLTYIDENGATTTVATQTFVQASSTTDIVVTGSGTQADPYEVAFTETHSTVTNTIAGNQIATFTNENNDVVNIFETVTDLSFSGTDLVYIDEDGATTTIDLSSLSSTTDELNTSLAFSSTTNTLGITDNGGLLTTIIDALSNITLLGTTVADVFTANEATITDLTTTNATTTNLVILGDVATLGTLSDSDGDVGINGQVLATTATGTNWVNVSNLETLTTIATSTGSFTYTDEDGNTTIVAGSDLETTTTLVGNGNGTFTYTDEEGGSTIIDTFWEEGATSGEVFYNGGNVGIGIADPGSRLHVGGGDITLDGSNNASFVINNQSALFSSAISFRSENTEYGRLRLNADNSLSLSGTTGNDVTIQGGNVAAVNILSGASGSIRIGGANATINFAPSDGSTVLAAFNTQGDLGIGDTTPDGSLKLDVEGQIGATEYCDQNGANCISASELAQASTTDELNQTLTFSSTTNTLGITDNGGLLTTIIDALSNITLLGTTAMDTFTANTGTITDLASTNATTTNLVVTGDVDLPAGSIEASDLAPGLAASSTDELQNLSFSTSTNQLTLSGGNTIDLSTLSATGTDNQVISYSTTTNTLTLEDGGSADLSNLENIWSEGVTPGEIYYTGGNVGIGTSTPSNKLSIVSAGLDQFLIENTNTTINTGGFEIFQGQPGNFDGTLITRSRDAGQIFMRVGSAGGVDLPQGATVEDGKSFGSESSVALAFYKPFDGTKGALSFRGATNAEAGFNVEAYYHNGTFNYTGSVARFEADASGNRVGINTLDPTAGLTLDVEGRVGATEYCDQNGANCISASELAQASTTDELNQTLTFSSTTNTLGITDNGGLLTTIIDALSNITLLGTTAMDTFTANTGTITDLASTNATTTNLVVTGDVDLPAGSIEASDLAPGLAASTTDELIDSVTFSTSTNVLTITESGNPFTADLSSLATVLDFTEASGTPVTAGTKIGDYYKDTTTSYTYVWDGSEWEQVGGADGCFLGAAYVDAAGTIENSSGVISSVTRNSAGKYTVNMSETQVVNDYSIQLTSHDTDVGQTNGSAAIIKVVTKGTDSFDVHIDYGDNGGTEDVETDSDFEVVLYDLACDPGSSGTSSGLADGTTTNSTLRWDGSDWVENTNLLADASGNATSTASIFSNIVRGVSGIFTDLTVSGITNLATTTVSTTLTTNNLVLNGTLADGDGGVGTAGQYLTSTATGTAWTSDIKIPNGTLILGHDTINTIPGYNFNKLEFWDETGAESDFTQRIAGGGYGVHNIIKSNGTLAAPTVVANGNIVGQYSFGAYDGTDYNPVANITAVIDGVAGDNDLPTALSFEVTADGSDTPTEAMRISNDGTVNITGSLTGAGLSDCDAATDRLQWDSTTGQFSCVSDTQEIQHFSDTSGETFNGNTDTNDLWNLATYPNITPESTTNEILIMVNWSGQSADTGTDYPQARIVRSLVDGIDPLCTTGVDIGQPMGFYETDAGLEMSASGIFVDTPASTGNVRYTLCEDTAGDSQGGNFALEEIQFTIMEVNNAADLAEIYPTNDISITTAEVVSVDPELPLGVKRTDTAYDSAALGVISTRPALAIGGSAGVGNNAVPVALSGRVPVKVSAIGGDIAMGDLLTSSNIPGVAMKANESGNVLGFALEDLSFDQEDEISEVMIFVNPYYAVIENGEAVELPLFAATSTATTTETAIDLAEVFEPLHNVTTLSVEWARELVQTTYNVFSYLHGMIIDNQENIAELQIENENLKIQNQDLANRIEDIENAIRNINANSDDNEEVEIIIENESEPEEQIDQTGDEGLDSIVEPEQINPEGNLEDVGDAGQLEFIDLSAENASSTNEEETDNQSDLVNDEILEESEEVTDIIPETENTEEQTEETENTKSTAEEEAIEQIPDSNDTEPNSSLVEEETQSPSQTETVETQ